MRTDSNNRQTVTEIDDSNKAFTIISYLRQGEELLWSGQPNPHCYQKQKRREAMPMFVGSALLMWALGLMSLSTNGFGSPPILLFAIGGMFLLFFSVIGKDQSAPKWWYAVTSQRIFSNYPTEGAEEIWQLSLRDIHNVKITKHQAEVGTISFNSSVLVLHTHLPFECVDDAERVCNLINNARSRISDT